MVPFLSDSQNIQRLVHPAKGMNLDFAFSWVLAIDTLDRSFLRQNERKMSSAGYHVKMQCE